jgi:hypothetical protein
LVRCDGGAEYQFFGHDYQVARRAAPHFPGMRRKTANIDIRIEPQVVDKIVAWRPNNESGRAERRRLSTCSSISSTTRSMRLLEHP